MGSEFHIAYMDVWTAALGLRVGRAVGGLDRIGLAKDAYIYISIQALTPPRHGVTYRGAHHICTSGVGGQA